MEEKRQTSARITAVKYDPEFISTDTNGGQLNAAADTFREQFAIVLGMLETARKDVEKFRGLAKSFAETNTVLRKIACHIPSKVYLKAKEDAGFGVNVTVGCTDPKVDEHWLEFISTATNGDKLNNVAIEEYARKIITTAARDEMRKLNQEEAEGEKEDALRGEELDKYWCRYAQCTFRGWAGSDGDTARLRQFAWVVLAEYVHQHYTSGK